MYSTCTLKEILEGCDSFEELKESVIPLLQDQREQWKAELQRILQETGLSVHKMAILCGVSDPTVRKWLNGSLPQNRDMYLKIGFAAGYDRARMDSFLTRFGRCPALYAKSLEDSVCIFVLQSGAVPRTYQMYTQLLNMVQQAMCDDELPQPQAVPMQELSTRKLDEALSLVTSTEEIVAFVRKNSEEFRRSYKRFYAYVIAFLNENLAYEGAEDSGRKRSFHDVAEEIGWSSSLQHCIYEIRRNTWFPQRMKVISLGLHLNMDVDSINEMLECACMEPLYPLNPIEAAVLWAVTDAELNSLDGELVRDCTDELCIHVRDILQKLEIADSEFLIEDLRSKEDTEE